jgi:CxxC-x17-CxxC domain-containing protein
MEDRTLVCEDCGQEFVFSREEQEFYAARGFQAPKRCKPCRSRRKEQRGGRGFGQRQMYAAVCADCGQETTVPFRPREDRPVYCRDCYLKRR